MNARVGAPTFHFGVLDVRQDWPWIKTKLCCHLVEDTSGLIARDRDGAYCAAVVFDTFTETSACCHIVIDNPLVLRRGFLHMVADAIFVHGKRLLLLGITPSSNAQALKFNERIGWKEIYRVKDGIAVGVDTVVQEMRRENCRWLQPEDRSNGR